MVRIILILLVGCMIGFISTEDIFGGILLFLIFVIVFTGIFWEYVKDWF